MNWEPSNSPVMENEVPQQKNKSNVNQVPPATVEGVWCWAGASEPSSWFLGPPWSIQTPSRSKHL